MKKNKMMRLASVLLVAVLLSTCAISGTFAKYVTSDNGTDSARVAKFGVEITANGTLFAEEYATDNESIVGTIAKSVISTDASNADVDGSIVAPGTKGNLAAMTISGTPEVAVEVKYAATLTLSGWANEAGTYYCPIEIKVGNDTLKGTDYDSMDAFETAVEEKINAYTANYAPNTDMSTVGAPVVSWEWAFEGNTDADDTYLGDVAATGTAATIDLSITTTVTQIN